MVWVSCCDVCDAMGEDYKNICMQYILVGSDVIPVHTMHLMCGMGVDD